MHGWKKLPEQFLTRLENIVPADKLDHVRNSFCVEKPISLRVNTLKTDKQTLQENLTSQGIQTEEVAWYSDGLMLKTGIKQQLTSTELFQDGFFYIQNLSSMIPVLVLNPQPGENILDIAAAPGSKTTQMAQMMHNHGEIVANDISRNRIFKLQSILQQQGVTNTTIINLPGEMLWKKYPNYFDKVLIDAPCTMEGRFQANDADTYIDWSIKKVKVLSSLQKNLLRSAFFATKPGGSIVYSTCTLEPEENEGIIDWLYTHEGKYIEIEKITVGELLFEKPKLNWQTKNFHNEVSHTARILPSEIMEGFFVAKLKRVM